MADASPRLRAPREKAIRTALRAWLAERLPPGAPIVEELGVKHGKFRVDVCAVGDMLHGFEIKSDQDTLARLPAQAEHFSQVFARLTLVIGPALLPGALAIVPPWWGIVLVTEAEDGAPRFAELREAGPNPRRKPRWLVHLLWRAELAVCLAQRGERGVSKLRYRALCERMLRAYGEDELDAVVATVLRVRYGGPERRPRPAVPTVAPPAPALTPSPPPAPAPAPPPPAEPSLQSLILGF